MIPEGKTLSEVACQAILFVLAALGITLASFVLFPLWFVDSPSMIDPWIYWGTAESPAYATRYFSETYYFRRWPLIGLAYVFQHLLDPFAAQVAMKGLLLFLILGTAGVIVALVTRKWSWPILGMAILGTSEYVVRNVGSSYHQGLSLFLFLVASALVIAAANTTWPRTVTLISGVICGLMFITYQLTVYLVVALAISLSYSLTRNRFFSRTLYGIKSVVCNLFIGGLLFLAGLFAVALVADKVVARWLGVSWENSISYAIDMRNIGIDFAPTATEDPLHTFLQPQAFLATMTLVFLGLLMLLISQRLVAPPLKAWFILFSGLTTIYVGGKVLGLHFMDSWPWSNIHYLVATLISVPILGFVATRSIQLSGAREWAASACLLIAWVTLANWSELWTLEGLSWWVIVIVPTVAFPFAAILNRRGRLFLQDAATWLRRLVRVLLASGLLAIIAALSVSMGWWLALGWHGAPYSSRDEARNFYLKLSTDHRELIQTALQFDKRVWILDLRPHATWSVNASAMYGMYSAFALGYPPALVSCENFNWVLDDTRSSVAVFGAESGAEALETLSALTRECDIDFQAVINAEASSNHAIWIDIARD